MFITLLDANLFKGVLANKNLVSGINLLHEYCKVKSSFNNLHPITPILLSLKILSSIFSIESPKTSTSGFNKSIFSYLEAFTPSLFPYPNPLFCIVFNTLTFLLFLFLLISCVYESLVEQLSTTIISYSILLILLITDFILLVLH